MVCGRCVCVWGVCVGGGGVCGENVCMVCGMCVWVWEGVGCGRCVRGGIRDWCVGCVKVCVVGVCGGDMWRGHDIHIVGAVCPYIHPPTPITRVPTHGCDDVIRDSTLFKDVWSDALEGNAAHWEMRTALQEVEILCHQCCCMH